VQFIEEIKMSILNLFEKEKETLVKDIQKFESVIKSDLTSIFAQAKIDAANANAKVDTLKSELALAIKNAAELSQKASDAAKAAADEATAQVQALTAEAQLHATIAASQASQIVVAPEAPSATLAQPS
jgi:hypothetical protein